MVIKRCSDYLGYRRRSLNNLIDYGLYLHKKLLYLNLENADDEVISLIQKILKFTTFYITEYESVTDLYINLDDGVYELICELYKLLGDDARSVGLDDPVQVYIRDIIDKTSDIGVSIDDYENNVFGEFFDTIKPFLEKIFEDDVYFLRKTYDYKTGEGLNLIIETDSYEDYQYEVLLRYIQPIQEDFGIGDNFFIDVELI